MAMAVETGNDFSFAAAKRLFEMPYAKRPQPYSRSYAVAHGGRFLMILPDEQNHAAALGSIVVVQNFGEELKRRVRPGGK